MIQLVIQAAFVIQGAPYAAAMNFLRAPPRHNTRARVPLANG